MDKQNITVLRKILYAVESGDQVYGKQDYSCFAGVGANCSNEKLLRSVRGSGTQEKQKNCYTGFREQTRSYSKTWIMQVWKKTC